MKGLRSRGRRTARRTPVSPKNPHVAPPEQVETRCPVCREETPHRVEKGHVAKGGAAVEGAFTCGTCGHTHQGLVTVPVPVDIPLIVSDDEGRTKPMSVQVVNEEDVRVSDEFEVEESLVEITAIELPDGRRVESAPADRVKTLWGKDITQIKVAFAMNVGPSTRAFEARFDPDESIAIGDKFDLDDEEVEVKQVVTQSGRQRHGRHNVREIRRVWLKSKGDRDRVVRRGPPQQQGRPARGRSQQSGPRSSRHKGRSPPAAGRSSAPPPRKNTRGPGRR